jgi:uncharacterized 2Fe-2S/4Fe-4S cluster protein (DUF4445 family)/DNA-binding GntR family transcriptional regulator
MTGRQLEVRGNFMDLVQVDAQRAYKLIREQIITLELAPGSSINEQNLAEDLDIDLISVQEALKLLAYDDLVKIDPQYGIYVANVSLAELEQLSEMRLTLEPLSARLAARYVTADDLVLLESLRQEHARIPVEDHKRLLDVDHKFHQAIAQAARNKYLAETLEHFFGLSQRLWYLALPRLTFLPDAVEEHLHLLEALKAGDDERAGQIMHDHVKGFYEKVREVLTVKVTVSYGSEVQSVVVEENALLANAIIATGLPLEQPCAGRGTCGKCKVLVEGNLKPPDEVEQKQISDTELLAGYRLACRARVTGDVSVKLAPIVVYSNKIFRTSSVYEQEDIPLGLAIDLGSTTVAAFLTTLTDGKVCAGAAALNHQTVFGADVISRLAEAGQGGEYAERLSKLAQVSIIQAIDALQLSPRVKARIHKVTIVGNCAMHHLLLRYPVNTLALLPFQPYNPETVRGNLLHGTVPSQAEVALPPLIGGFVGSDALACLAYFGFDRAPGPMAAIDLGTNGEVMVTDGKRVLVASTAAGPAFEGVNISCGTRAVDGAIVGTRAHTKDGSFTFTTIGDQPPVGLTGSGLLSLVYELRRTGVIQSNGRFVPDHPTFGNRIGKDENDVRRIILTDEAADNVLFLSQRDVRELQKAKGAIRTAVEILLDKLGLQASNLQRLILTGSFGSQMDIEVVLALGVVPPVNPNIIETVANGAGLGAALFLNDEEFARGERIADQAEQIDLDQDPDFNMRFIHALDLLGTV